MIDRLERLLEAVAPSFPCLEDYQRARVHWLSGLLNLGRHTIAGALCTCGRQHQDWSADYRAQQRLPVQPVFAHIQRETLARTRGAWVVALDDSITRKTGRCIPGCGWRADPLSPPFQVNFVWGQRVLQFSAALPAADGSARLVPVDWCEAPMPRKPGRHASAEQVHNYREARKQANINRVAIERITGLCASAGERLVHLVGDGRFTNRTLIRHLPGNSVLIGRVRKDCRLHAPCAPRPGQPGRPRRYGKLMPTPEALRTDPDTAWSEVHAFAVEQVHTFRIKTLSPVLARFCGVDRPVRIVVVAPVGYRLRKNARLLYRQPAFLLCTDPELSPEQVLQEYLWRWDIEVNFRDEKTLLGVSEAQVRHPETVRRHPAGAVAAYALLLLAAHELYAHDQLPPAVALPKWRRSDPPRRPTTGMLLSQLRVEMWSRCIRQESLAHFSSSPPPDHNADKLPLSLASALFHAHN